MALSPSIPTSFVPKQPVSPGVKRTSGTNILLLVSIVILGVAIAASVCVFIYDQYLISTEKAKAAQLIQAQQNVSLSKVQDFVRLRNRLLASKTILNNHIELSKFFTLLGNITSQNVTFTGLQIQVADDHSAKIELKGVAKTFNTLAVESTAFAQQPDIKSAIFSGITINKGTVNFTVDATLAPELIVGTAVTNAVTNTAPAASTTPSVSKPSVTTLPVTVSTSSSSVHVAPSTASTTKL